MVIFLRVLSVFSLLIGVGLMAHSLRFNDSFLVALFAYVFLFTAALVWPWGAKVGDKRRFYAKGDLARMAAKFKETL